VAGAAPIRVLVLAATGLAVVAPVATAATVSVVDVSTFGGTPGQYALFYSAGPGEVNRLTASESFPARAWIVRDTGATVIPGPNCAALGGAVACFVPASATGVPPLINATIDLGDGDDHAQIAGSRYSMAEVEAGPGDDALLVTTGWVNANMGPGDDRARGIGDDLLGGGLRRGGLSVFGGTGADTIDAGRHADVDALYFDEPRGVRVTPDGRANDGTPGEHDNVARGVRRVSGSNHDDVLDARGARGRVGLDGSSGDDLLFASPAGGGLEGQQGDDVLRGGPGPDSLGGADGDDRLFGGAGDDVLGGDAGRNVLTGGRGHDTYFVYSDTLDVIHAGDGARDSVDCMQQLPRRLQVDRRDRLTQCAFPVTVEGTPALDRRGRVHITLACPRLAPGGCRVALRLIDTSPAPLANARISIPAGGTARRAIKLSHTPRNLLLTAIAVNHRARPPASQRTTAEGFQLASP
jgi:RTX calcium-binding nonapeptide repeat (4 copies)